MRRSYIETSWTGLVGDIYSWSVYLGYVTNSSALETYRIRMENLVMNGAQQ
jgi:hypothetical protein